MKRTMDSEGDEDDYRPEADDAGVFWCPHCGSEMYGDASRCPKCGDFVTPGRRPSSGTMPWWMWAVMVVVGLALLAGLLNSFL